MYRFQNIIEIHSSCVFVLENVERSLVALKKKSIEMDKVSHVFYVFLKSFSQVFFVDYIIPMFAAQKKKNKSTIFC